ncbi:tetratricopeptide repeat protein [bacterium]|nr:tetratricopeptide repeat protein [bacterium]
MLDKKTEEALEFLNSIKDFLVSSFEQENIESALQVLCSENGYILNAVVEISLTLITDICNALESLQENPIYYTPFDEHIKKIEETLKEIYNENRVVLDSLLINSVNQLKQETILDEYELESELMIPETSRDYFHKGAFHLKQDEYEEALQCFVQGVEDNDEDIFLFNNALGILMSLLHLGREDEAEEWYEEILDMLDEQNCSHIRFDTHLKIGHTYVLQKNYLKAIEQFYLAIESLKRVFLRGVLINSSCIAVDADEELLMDMFFALDYIDYIVESIQTVPKTPEIQPIRQKIRADIKFVVLRMEKILLQDLTEGKEAYSKEILKNKIKECKQEIKKNPDDIFSYFNMAQIYSLLDMLKEQEVCYDAILKIEPNNFYGLYGKGALLSDFGFYKEAVFYFDRLIEVKPDCEDGWWSKGGVLIELGKSLEALKYFEEALRIDPNCFEATNGMGWAYKSLNKTREALDWFDKALTMNGDSSEVWNVKGSILSSLDRKDEALECYNKALEIDPQDVFILNNKNGVLIELGRYEEAEECIQQIIKINPKHAPAYYNKACLRVLTNNKKDALLNLKKAIELDSSFKEYAKKDKDFSSIKDDNDFQNLLR